MKDINDLIQENQNGNNVDNANDLNKAHYQAVTSQGAEEVLDEKMQELTQREIEDELKVKAQQMGVGYVNLKGVPVPANVLQLIALEEVKEKQVVCFYYAQHKVARLATTKLNIDEIQNLKTEFEKRLKLPVEIYITSKKSFDSVVKLYEAVPKIKPAPKGVEVTENDLKKFSEKLFSLESVKELIKEVSISELVTVIIAAGLKTNSSDIHIEAEVDGIKLRYRVDGVLHTACILEKSIWQQLISRLKLLSGLKLNITDKPQDGRFSIFLKDDKVDVRVSTLPTAYGESVVMRLLRSKVTSLRFEDLGLEGRAFELLSSQIRRPNGMIITTGPTGSGKTTTLYAILNKLNTPETKIITIEDPIEYELKGINQSQVNPNRDYTFAKGLRSIVRQDPDIIMVGEMRDLETVDIALNAALTGHLVLSTLHTNDAAGAVPRFLSMGAKPYLLAPALNLVMAQRLVRKLCEKCKKEIELDESVKDKIWKVLSEVDPQEIRKYFLNAKSGSSLCFENKEIKSKEDLSRIKFYGPGGCKECNQIGYKGRIGIFEMFEMRPEIEQIILSNEVSEYKIREIAKRNGMVTMVQDGLLKAIKGITSVEEVFRVVE